MIRWYKEIVFFKKKMKYSKIISALFEITTKQKPLKIGNYIDVEKNNPILNDRNKCWFAEKSEMNSKRDWGNV